MINRAISCDNSIKTPEIYNSIERQLEILPIAPVYYRIKYILNKITEIRMQICYFYQFDHKISNTHRLISLRLWFEVRIYKLIHLTKITKIIKISIQLTKALRDKQLIMINTGGNKSSIRIELNPQCLCIETIIRSNLNKEILTRHINQPHQLLIIS